MKSYIDQLERLGHLVTLNLGVSLILVGLSKEYDNFVQNYNMHNMGKTINELHAMLKLHEETLPKKVTAPVLHAIRAGKVQKNKNKKPSKAAKWVQGKGKEAESRGAFEYCTWAMVQSAAVKLLDFSFMSPGLVLFFEQIVIMHLLLLEGLF
ncbi:hypothetical protein Tco_0674614 [Tanacetum coccineum]